MIYAVMFFVVICAVLKTLYHYEDDVDLFMSEEEWKDALF